MTGQRLPTAGPERERLRQKGQFWTPDWVADAMVAYAAGRTAPDLFDPAVGAGAFFRAARRLESRIGRRLDLAGAEIDTAALDEALASGLTEGDLRGVEIRDFVGTPPEGPFSAIVANPPYIRHHRLSPSVKATLRAIASKTVGRPLDGRAGLHIYFLLRALERLREGGRLAFIMPADTCEGVFAPNLWRWIGERFRLDAVISFTPEATPFPQVDTNPLIFLISNDPPAREIHWARCVRAETESLSRWTASDFAESDPQALDIRRRGLSEALETGLSRPPAGNRDPELRLSHFATVVRGIATGANAFFFLTRQRAEELGIPSEFRHPAIGRTRDAPENELTTEALDALDAKGRPTVLFTPDGRSRRRFPPSVQRYLANGESEGVSTRSLISTRNPWYKMERRDPPPLLFAYLGRRNARFIRNRAGVIPLSNFSCVYPHDPDPGAADRLWQALQHPTTAANLARVGKSYGSGAIKVEPRALERLPIRAAVAAAAGLPVESRAAEPPGLFAATA